MMLVTRIGWSGDYETVDGVGELIDLFREKGVSGPLEKHGLYGVSNADYRGNNYISLYWGTDVETPEEGVTEEELEKINTALKSDD